MNAFLFFGLVALSSVARAIGPADACALLTRDEVSAALGVTVQAGKRLVATNPAACAWAPAGGPTIGGKKLVLALMTERIFEVGKTPFPHIAKTPVSGIGDDAYYVTTRGLGTALNVRKGTSCFQVKVGGLTEEAEKTIEKKLAQVVLTRV